MLDFCLNVAIDPVIQVPSKSVGKSQWRPSLQLGRMVALVVSSLGRTIVIGEKTDSHRRLRGNDRCPRPSGVSGLPAVFEIVSDEVSTLDGQYSGCEPKYFGAGSVPGRRSWWLADSAIPRPPTCTT